MNTIERKVAIDVGGLFLFIEPGGKHGYDSALVDLIERVSPYLDEFWFFVLWNYQYFDEFSNRDGKLTISTNNRLSTNDYDDYFQERLRSKPSILSSYLLDSGLFAKRLFEDALDEQDRTNAAEDFPDAIRILNRALEVQPGNPDTLNALSWYEQRCQ